MPDPTPGAPAPHPSPLGAFVTGAPHESLAELLNTLDESQIMLRLDRLEDELGAWKVLLKAVRQRDMFKKYAAPESEVSA